jgi:rRNA pseudouridine-1189 N-methylase Emg1 (Nep1/Mra1 family)
MSKHLWNSSITVAMPNSGEYVTINNSERAMRYLLLEWPRKRPDIVHAIAKKTLLKAAEGTVSADEAHDAFLAAVIAAGILVRE